MKRRSLQLKTVNDLIDGPSLFWITCKNISFSSLITLGTFHAEEHLRLSSRNSIFFVKFPADQSLVFNWSQAQVQFFQEEFSLFVFYVESWMKEEGYYLKILQEFCFWPWQNLYIVILTYWWTADFEQVPFSVDWCSYNSISTLL